MLKEFSDSALADVRAALPAYLARVHGVTDLRRPFKCLNPDHDDRNPSMGFHLDADGIARVRCFACGWSGDVIDLAALDNKLDARRDFKEAVRLAADGAGAMLDGADGPRGGHSAADRPAALRDLLPQAQSAFEALYGPKASDALAYLHGRGFDDETICKNGWGWVDCPHDLMTGFPTSLQAPGGFILLPFPDPHWRAARYAVVRPVGGSPRFKEMKPKGVAAPLWHEHALSRAGVAYVAEGIFDAVALSLLLGRETSDDFISLMGTGGVARMLAVLRDTPTASRPRIVLALDSDDAGAKATGRACEGLEGLGVPYKVLPMPKGVHDPNDWLLARKAAHDAA